MLSDVTGAVYDKGVAEVIKEFVSYNTPFMKASAVVGADGVRRVSLSKIIILPGERLNNLI